MFQYLEIGKIINTHGISGHVKILPLTDDPERYHNLDWVYMESNGCLQKYTIENVRLVKNLVLVKLEGIDNMDQASILRGKMLLVGRENAVKLPQYSYFICDLIGLEVFDEKGTKLGRLKDVIETGANDVFVVESENKKEVLIPALRSIVRYISVEDGLMEVTLPEGLVDDEV